MSTNATTNGQPKLATQVRRRKRTPAQRRAYRARRAQRKKVHPRYNTKTFNNPSVFKGKGDYTKEDKKKVKRTIRKELAKHQSQPQPTQDKDWLDGLVKMGAEWLPKIAPYLLGMGDYETGAMPESNSIAALATNGEVGGEVPYMHSSGARVRVAHREYIGDLYSSTAAFTIITFTINPGMNETFPWLSYIANNFTNYRMLGMCVEFKSEGSSYSNVAGLGYVAIATQYNVNEVTFTDKRSMLNYEFSTSGKPSDSMIHCVECKPYEIGDGTRGVRSGTIENVQDLRLYDLGKFSVAVGGNTTGSTVIGELWLTYDVEFLLPKMIDSGARNTLFSRFSTSTGVADAAPLGTSAWSYSSRSTFQWASITSTVLAFPQGVRGLFAFVVTWIGGAVTWVPPAITYTNCTSVAMWGAAGACPITGTATTTAACMRFAALVAQDGATITFGGGGTVITTTVEAHTFQIPQEDLFNSPIFDRGGLHEVERYEKFISSFLDEKSSKILSKAQLKSEKLESKEKLKNILPDPPGYVIVFDTPKYDVWTSGIVSASNYLVRRKMDGSSCPITLNQFLKLKKRNDLEAIEDYIYELGLFSDDSSLDEHIY